MQLAPFIVRDDVYALAYPDKSKPGKVRYALKEAALTADVLHEHLLGRELVGVYTLSQESKVKFFAIDFDGTDVAQAKQEALAQGQVLAGAGLVCYYEVSRSGNGVHLWGFFDEPIAAADVRARLKPLCVRSETYDRLYPLQNAVTESLPYGNLLALPFYGILSPEAKLRHGPGFHGGGSYFYDPQSGDRLDPDALLANLVANRVEYFQTLPGVTVANGLGRALPVLANAKQGEALRPKTPLNGVVKLVSPYGCGFMRHAYEQRATLSEPAWWTALGQLSCFVNGRDAAHMFSEGYPSYSPAATDEKFDRFLEQSPHSCAYIQEHFPDLACKQCPNTAPYRLAEKPILDLVSESVEPMERPTYESTLEQIRQTRQGEAPPGLDFGVEAIDQYTRIRPGQLLVFGAFPSLGKTAYAVDLAVNLAESGVPVMFFSAETGRGGIETRLLARKSDVDSKAIRGERRDYRGEHLPLTDDELARLETAAAELRELPIYLNYTTCNPDRILDAIDELLLRYRIPFEGPYVVMVDYLQFANTAGEADMPEHQRLAKLTNEFKHITKITKQPLFLFSQLKREKENGDEDPNLNWFKGTGRIETDADVAFILTGTRTPGPVAKRQLWSVKDREGEAGWVADLTFHQAVSRFETPPKLSKAQFQQDAQSLFDDHDDANAV